MKYSVGFWRSLPCIKCSVIVSGGELSCGEGFNPDLAFRILFPHVKSPVVFGENFRTRKVSYFACIPLKNKNPCLQFLTFKFRLCPHLSLIWPSTALMLIQINSCFLFCFSFFSPFFNNLVSCSVVGTRRLALVAEDGGLFLACVTPLSSFWPFCNHLCCL